MSQSVPALPAPAGFWKRYVAYFIDLLIVYAALELVLAVIGPGDRATLAQLQALTAAAQRGEVAPGDLLAALTPVLDGLSRRMLWANVGYVLLGGLYFAGLESSAWQATVGKRLLGLRVTDAAGARLTPARALARFLAAGLSWLTFNLGHALAAWTPERRALHDYLAGTRVVLAGPEHARMPAWGWAIVGLHALLFVGFTVALVAAVVMVFAAISAI